MSTHPKSAALKVFPFHDVADGHVDKLSFTVEIGPVPASAEASGVSS